MWSVQSNQRIINNIKRQQQQQLKLKQKQNKKNLIELVIFQINYVFERTNHFYQTYFGEKINNFSKNVKIIENWKSS